MAIGIYSVSMPVIFFCFLTTMILSADASWRRCTQQSTEEATAIRENCKYGVYEDNCSNLQCARAPGASCGRPGAMFSSVGRCGSGTFCKCGRCMGCNLLAVPMECYDKTCFSHDD